MAESINGIHLIADLMDCGLASADVAGTLEAMKDAVDQMHGTLLKLQSHSFSPQGHTAVALLAESHLALHSWPEIGYVAVDVFTCGDDVHPELGIEALKAYFQPQSVSMRRITRGPTSSPD